MQSTIIYGNTKQLRLLKANELLNDLGGIKPENRLNLVVSDDSSVISIGQVREAIKFIHIRPKESDMKVVLIEEAESMNLEAQNAILKTLEEPPAYALILILTSKKSFLLDTIISRCLLIQSDREDVNKEIDSEVKEVMSSIESLLNGSIGVRLDWVSENKKRLGEKEFLEIWLDSFEKVLRNKMVSNMNIKISKDLYKLFQTRKEIFTGNSSAILCIESFLVNL